MINRRRVAFATLSIAFLASLGFSSAQEVQTGYPEAYADVIAGAKAEGSVSVYASTDYEQARGLVEGFQKRFPGVRVDYNDISSMALYSRVISEAAARQVGSDVVWTGPDLLISLVQQGHAETYVSPEAPNLTDGLRYRDMLYATSIEPTAILYNKLLLKPEFIPKTRAQLLAILTANPEELRGKIATFDIEKSGGGFAFATADQRLKGDYWDLMRAFGKADGKVYSSAGAMREKVLSGEHLIAFNILGAYALDWAKQNPNLGVVFTSDYTLAFPRTAFVVKGAKHPNAARLFLDYMLSKEGQSFTATKGLPSPRQDVEGLSIRTITELAGGGLSILPLDEQLAEYLDPQKRVKFLQEWKKSLSR
jgi:iron(III) transport system substrate-binding protein